jgi:prepilin-type N-terminal cleavage/methylation domain-containing protein/prepilin-type processing-associated H-X9-DG protein
VAADRCRHRTGFTLIEVLVVIAILSVVVALLIPAVQKVRDAAARTQCESNLKQIALALHNYHDGYGRFPHGGVMNGPCCNTPCGPTWTVFLLPYLDQEELYKHYDFSVPNEHPNNRHVRTRSLSIYTCPVDPNSNRVVQPESGPGTGLDFATGSYRAVTGRSDASGWFDADDAARLRQSWRGVLHLGVDARYPPGPGKFDLPYAHQERSDTITDGLSNTVMVGEYMTVTHASRTTLWGYTYTSYNKSTMLLPPESRQLLPDYDRCIDIGGPTGDNLCKRGWASLHAENFLNFAFADGSVRGVTPNVDMTLLAALATICTGEPVIVD